MLQKNWLLKEFDRERVVEISKEFRVSPLTSIILYNRGIRSSAVSYTHLTLPTT